MITWGDQTPIYRQLKERLLAQILEGTLKAGDPLPSVRQVAAALQINPITVSRSFQELVDDGLVEKRRGIGMYVLANAQANLLVRERAHFFSDEWPRTLDRIARLGLDVQSLPTSSGATP
jgi:GntR family transcriptional regulator